MTQNDDELLAIGRFAHLSGLSQHTLRHYDEVALLRPAVVDPASRYRRYRREQLGTARLIRALRWLDLPIEQVREILADPDGPAAAATLAGYRERLLRGQSLVADRVAAIDRMLTTGVTMSTTAAPLTGVRPVQLKITVDDLDAAVAFYRDAFGLTQDPVRHTDDETYSAILFGEYGAADFFMLHLMNDPTDMDRPGPSTFGLLADDLDARHAAALAAGGTEIIPPQGDEGMPRNSAVRDPAGNWIWLYQN